MTYQYIDDQKDLELLCRKLSQATMLAIDTEFVRTRTLYAKLGLLQVSDGEVLALIDPIAVSDLTPFWQLLTDPAILKVLHACSEDLEVFMTAGDCKPENLIDTQIMMSFLGHGLSVGYAAMVKHYTDIELDKSESRTDWTKRPLSQRQLVYASADVEHLYALYPTLLAETQQSGFLDYAKEESQALIDKKFTAIDDNVLYRSIKLAWRLNPVQLNRLKHLTRWRYQQAKKRDLPIGFIAKDHTLMALAQYNPRSTSAMLQLEGPEQLDIRHKGKAMLAVLKQAEQDDEGSYPAKVRRLDEYPGYKQIFKNVKQFVAKVSKEKGIPVENLASKKQINQFLSWHFKLLDSDQVADRIDLLFGWRKDVLGDALLKFSTNKFQ
ncbi:ribonuclease D [Litorilituus lipolyticus]|uniref:Ribonuclease D n=1 Tax=Litorilituus lipolyticus TaxID=2491017 RepID=A0A502KLR6_9GAMM|nr:ribonuclease D [Litorilituus lipolyticus]TPH12570.1 ribonuclease D [Litorilituus lipolyticus]